MFFKFNRLSEQLVYIRWYDTPAIGDPAEVQFLEEAKTIVKSAEKPQYFISDLRKGRLTNIEVLHKLGSVARHPMWGGGTGFTQDPLSKIFAGIYVRFAKSAQSRDGMFERPEEALEFLEGLKPGITQGIDWAEVLGIAVKTEEKKPVVSDATSTPDSPVAATPETPAKAEVVTDAPAVPVVEAPVAATTETPAVSVAEAPVVAAKEEAIVETPVPPVTEATPVATADSPTATPPAPAESANA